MKKVIGFLLIGISVLVICGWIITMGFWGYHTFQWQMELNQGIAFGPHYDQNQVWFPRLIIGYILTMISSIPLGIGIALTEED